MGGREKENRREANKEGRARKNRSGTKTLYPEFMNELLHRRHKFQVKIFIKFFEETQLRIRR